MAVQPDRASRRRAPLLPVLGLVVGACATLPALVGPELATADAAEIADHLVPGLVVLAVSAVALVVGRSSRVSSVVPLAAGLVTSLAGLWMVATHVPLVAQATRHEAPWDATIFHGASAVMVLGVGLAWAWASWATPQ